MNTRKISKNNSEIKLTNIEHNLLELLIENAGKKLSRAVILDNIWGYTPERYVDTRMVDVHISRLRLKIEVDPKNPDLIITTRGIGYMFQLN
jgi:OmpR family response regulator RpaB